MVKAQLGTIIHGTLRTQDLLRAFAYTLNELNDGRHSILFNDALSLAYKLDNLEDDDRVTELYDAADETVSQLFDALQDFAPADAYFGSHEGDGSDFGFWPLSDIPVYAAEGWEEF